MSLLISIDYDDTYAADPDLWEQFARTAISRGHQVVICTARAFPPTQRLPVPVFCSAGQAKADYLAQMGMRPSIWIDDDPGSVIACDPATS